MKLAWMLAIASALSLHAGFLLFGGLLFPGAGEGKGSTQEVELLSAVEAEPDKPEEPKIEEPQEIEADEEQPPDPIEIAPRIELAPMNDVPALDAASLSAIEAALDGLGGGGEFVDSVSFSSGGRIGGMGKDGVAGATLESAFSMAEIDQKPRAIFQASPLYPSEVRGKKLDGTVTLIFVVDASGKVTNQRVEKSTHPAFEKPAIEALKQWKFEPAVKSGERVACKMRVGIRFQPS